MQELRVLFSRLLVPLAILFLATTPATAQTPLVPSAGTLIAQQQSRLGAQPGVILLDQPSRLDHDLTLAPNQSLRIDAPLSITHATIHLAGHNDIRCNAPITLDTPTDLFVADDATDLSVRNCDITVLHQSGGYLLTATHAARITLTDNHLLNLELFNTHNRGGGTPGTTDVTITSNSTEITHYNAQIGVYLLYVLRAVVSDNRFIGTGHGIQWWGGDGNIGWHGSDAVTEAGDLSISGNQCFNAGGACVWGSMGFNVAVTGNTAEHCGDVCFDTEGGVHNLFTGNLARDCHAGCYSAQMETVDTVFSANFAYADAKAPALALVLIKHRNGNPAGHTNLAVTGNTLVCGAPCTAFYSEGEDGLDLSHNTIVNGIFTFANYTNSVRIADNSLRFTQPFGPHAAISGPSLFNAHTSLIENNTVLNDNAPLDPNATCIAQSWSDDNNTDEMHITGNTCIAFPHGISTETAGHNNGAPQARWFIQSNTFSQIPPDQQLLHKHTSGNETYLTTPKP